MVALDTGAFASPPSQADCPSQATAPSASDLAAAYNESIAYVNAIGGSKFTRKQLDDADVEASAVDKRKIEKGEKLFVLAPDPDSFSNADELRGGAAQWQMPLWLCESQAQSYETETDAAPSLQVAWWSCNPNRQGDMAGKWFPMCKGGHKLVGNCRGNGHGPWIDTINRDEIRITGVELNKKDPAGTYSLSARKKYSARAQLASALKSMGQLDGNTPKDWLPKVGIKKQKK